MLVVKVSFIVSKTISGLTQDTLISDAETKNDLVKYIVSKLAINRTANISIIVRLTNKIAELQNLKYYSFATASSSFLSVTKVSKTNQGI